MDERSDQGPVAVSPSPAKKQKHSPSCGCGGSCGCSPPVKKLETNEMYWSDDSDDDYYYIPAGSDSKQIDRETWDKYMNQVTQSEGFDIYDYPGCCPMARIFPFPSFDKRPEFLAKVNALASKAIDKFNSENVQDKDYKFMKIEKVNGELVGGLIYYITFQARKDDADPDDESTLVTFQARVFDPIALNEQKVYFCRIKGSVDC